MDDFWASLKGLCLTGPYIRAYHAGGRQTRRAGNSHDMTGHRPYIPGDDMRHVDWHAYARTGHLHMRTHAERGRHQLTIWLDDSASMAITAAKWELACQLAAGCTYIAVQQGERVCLRTLVTGDVLYEGSSADEQTCRALERVLHLSAAGVAAYTGYIQQRERETVLVISDFFGCELAQLLAAIPAARNDVRIVHVLATVEKVPPQAGMVRLVDKETGHAQQVEMTAALRRAYAEKVQHFLQASAEQCRSHGALYVQATDDELARTLLPRIVGGR